MQLGFDMLVIVALAVAWALWDRHQARAPLIMARYSRKPWWKRLWVQVRAKNPLRH